MESSLLCPIKSYLLKPESSLHPLPTAAKWFEMCWQIGVTFPHIQYFTYNDDNSKIFSSFTINMESMSPRIDSVESMSVVLKSLKIRDLFSCCLARQVFTRRVFLLYGLLIDLLKGKNAAKICLLTHTVRILDITPTLCCSRGIGWGWTKFRLHLLLKVSRNFIFLFREINLRKNQQISSLLQLFTQNSIFEKIFQRFENVHENAK
jgi:hypothetical protein